MKIKNILNFFKRNKIQKEILLNQKLNKIQNDLTMMKMQINTIVRILKERKD